MKRVACASLLMLFFLSLTLPASTGADSEGPSANGSFQFSVEGGQTRDIKFDAKLARDGSTTGEITFRDAGPAVTVSKPTVESEAGEALPPFFAKAACDCLVVRGVEAVMSGTVTESSRENFIGRRVLLSVQDGDSLNPPLRDKLTFGFYKTTVKGWVATDVERPEDGPAPTWVATDAERPDDPGTLSQKSDEITCETFPFSSHSFLVAKQGKGKIQVTR